MLSVVAGSTKEAAPPSAAGNTLLAPHSFVFFRGWSISGSGLLKLSPARAHGPDSQRVKTSARCTSHQNVRVHVTLVCLCPPPTGCETIKKRLKPQRPLLGGNHFKAFLDGNRVSALLPAALERERRPMVRPTTRQAFFFKSFQIAAFRRLRNDPSDRSGTLRYMTASPVIVIMLIIVVHNHSGFSQPEGEYDQTRSHSVLLLSREGGN